MQPVCSVLEEIWPLRVVCDCRAKNPELSCTSACMRDSLTAMGISVQLGSRDVLVHAHPNALGAQWSLKMGIPFKKFSGHHAQMGYLRFHRGHVQCAAVSCHMGRISSVPCRLDAACNIVPIPAVHRAECNDLRGRTCSSAHAVGY